MNHAFSEIEVLVREFIVQTEALNQCMRDYQRHFSSSDFVALEQSDLEKSEINTKLQKIIQTLSTHPAIEITYGDLLVKLSCYAGTLDVGRQSILLGLIQQMREGHKTRLRLTHLNRHAVNANLAYVKELLSDFM